MRTLQIHSHKKQKEGFALGNSSFLKIQGFERNLLHHLCFFLIIYLFQLRKLFAANLLYLRVALLSEGRAGGTEMSGFSAAEAEFLFHAVFTFFRSEFGNFDGIYDHGVRVMSLG